MSWDDLSNNISRCGTADALKIDTHSCLRSSSALAGPSAPMSQHETFSPQSTFSLTHSSPSYTHENPLKRKRSHFSLHSETVIAEFVAEGTLSEEQAYECFTSFFRGCDRYVPIFDATDTFQAVRSRSCLLLNTICAIGCSVSENTAVDSRSLYAQLKRSLAIVILSPNTHSLETVQALLVGGSLCRMTLPTDYSPDNGMLDA